MPLSLAFLLALLLPAQNSSQLQDQSQSPEWLGPVPQFQGSLGQLQTKRFNAEDFLAEQNSHMCFAIRSYIFKRNDGKAPILVKTMTCTPNTVFLKRAGPPPKGLYVPLKLNLIQRVLPCYNVRQMRFLR